MSKVITISHNDILSNTDLTTQIEAAFGKDGLGLILIKDYPDFQLKRRAVLNAIRKFGALSDDIKEKYVHAESNYSVGWSHGKEKMRNGKPDHAKGSYYALTLADSITDDVQLKKEFPAIYADNIWPREDLPELETSFKDMTKVQMDIGYAMCGQFDRYLHKVTNGAHQPSTIYDMMKLGNSYKGRLLHYFPTKESLSSQQQDGLCGWHLDHGGVTILLSPMYFDSDGNEMKKPDDCGLYIKAPLDGSIIKMDVPEDCILVQLGESLQFLSGGFLRATPHCVKSSKTPNMTREQLACFMDWLPSQSIKLPVYSLPYDNVVTCYHLPEGVPNLDKRIRYVKEYKEFAVNTFNAYYNA